MYLDRDTGELRVRRHDETAYSHTDHDGTGRTIVFTSARLPHGRERWILGFTDLCRGEDTGDKEQEIPAFMEHVKWLKRELGDNLKVAIYDMALSARYQKELYKIRVIPVVKVPRVKGRKAKSGRLDKPITFKLQDGTRQTMDVYTDDGWPVIIVLVDGKEHFVHLQKSKRNWNGPSLGFFYTIPDHPAVPRELRKAEGRYGMNPFKSNEALFTHFRAVPEGSDEFVGIFGNREDTESIHSGLKRRLANKRARSWTRTGQLIDILAFAVFTNIRANTAKGIRTQDPPLDLAA